MHRGPDRSGVRRNNPSSARGKQANFGHIDSARFGRESISVFAFADVAIILGRGELHNPIVAIDAGQHFRSRPTQRAAHREQCVKILGAVSSEHARAFSSQLIEVRRSRRTRQRYLRNIFECAHAVEPHDGKPGDGTHGERIDAVRIEATDRPANAPIRRASCRQTRRTRRRADVAAQRKRAFPAEG